MPPEDGAGPSGRARLRQFLSYATYTGVVPPPSAFRPAGVSCFIIAKNEEEWAETSVLSVVDHVDEVLVADHGSEDATGDIFREVSAAHPDRVRTFSLPEDSFHGALNRMLRECRFRWILRFNADFVARTSGPHSIARLVDTLRSMDRRRYYSITLSGIALDGDVFHQFPNRRDPHEPLVFTYSPWLQYGVKGRWESLHVPWFYEKVAIREPYHFHMRSVKSLHRMLQKLYWSHWYEARNQGSAVSLRDFIAARAREEWGGRTLEEAARNYILLEFSGCVPYSRDLCGEYPEILLPALRDPPFRLVFEGGKLVDRIEGQRYRPPRAGA